MKKDDDEEEEEGIIISKIWRTHPNTKWKGTVEEMDYIVTLIYGIRTIWWDTVYKSRLSQLLFFVSIVKMVCIRLEKQYMIVKMKFCYCIFLTCAKKRGLKFCESKVFVKGRVPVLDG